MENISIYMIQLRFSKIAITQICDFSYYLFLKQNWNFSWNWIFTFNCSDIYYKPQKHISLLTYFLFKIRCRIFSKTIKKFPKWKNRCHTCDYFSFSFEKSSYSTLRFCLEKFSCLVFSKLRKKMGVAFPSIL